jgi:hypothetical protein
MTHITVSADVYDVLEQIDDEDIKREYEERNLGLGSGTETWDEVVELQKAHLHHHMGRKAEAYEILWKMCLIKLNKVV